MTARTFPDLLAERLRRDAAQPFVTMYDDATGERTELSVATYANWVSKNANLLVDELDLGAGDTVLIDLPAHWLVPVFAGAAWSAGIEVSTDPAADHDLLVCGPDVPADWPQPVLACALLPFAVRFRERPAPPALDHGELWPGQPDVFVPFEPLGLEVGEVAPGTRLLTDEHPLHDGGAELLGLLAGGGSLVLVRHPTDDGWPARQEAERASVVRRAGQPMSE